MTQDPGPKPDAESSSGTPAPGGPDAVESTAGVEHAGAEVADLSPDRNPAIEDALPDEMREGEDTETEATSDRDADDVDPEDESPV